MATSQEKGKQELSVHLYILYLSCLFLYLEEASDITVYTLHYILSLGISFSTKLL